MLAKRTQNMKSSAIRELLKITQLPDVISFAGGLPAAELFPVREIEEACHYLL
ncbi:MAG TPA: aminotransferase, partial [Chloroflexi bacterium]|nr:aminotransferase [Chloroflexota bacterium]